MCRIKERAKRAGAQRKEEEGDRKSLQVILIQTEQYISVKSVSRWLFSHTPHSLSPSCVVSLSQSKLEQTEGELRSLSKEFQVLRNSLAQRDTSVLQLQNSITTLTQKLTAAHRKEVRHRFGNQRRRVGERG